MRNSPCSSQAGSTPVIITARRSNILENRYMGLNISKLHQGINKLAKLKDVVGEDLSTVAYAGDDLPDIPCMEAVKISWGNSTMSGRCNLENKNNSRLYV